MTFCFAESIQLPSPTSISTFKAFVLVELAAIEAARSAVLTEFGHPIGCDYEAGFVMRVDATNDESSIDHANKLQTALEGGPLMSQWLRSHSTSPPISPPPPTPQPPPPKTAPADPTAPSIETKSYLGLSLTGFIGLTSVLGLAVLFLCCQLLSGRRCRRRSLPKLGGDMIVTGRALPFNGRVSTEYEKHSGKSAFTNPAYASPSALGRSGPHWDAPPAVTLRQLSQLQDSSEDGFTFDPIIKLDMHGSFKRDDPSTELVNLGDAIPTTNVTPALHISATGAPYLASEAIAWGALWEPQS